MEKVYLTDRCLKWIDLCKDCCDYEGCGRSLQRLTLYDPFYRTGIIFFS